MAANINDPVVEGCQPPDVNIKVWRYMDPLQLLALLQTRSLYFSRADKFEDPFEGTLPKLNQITQHLQTQHIVAQARKNTPPEHWRAIGNAEEMVEGFQDITRKARQCAYICCWHAGETESLAMWKLYGTDTGSVAIQSTYGKLLESLPPTLCISEPIMEDEPWTSEIYMGMVQYKDYIGDKDRIPGGNLRHPYIHKRKELEHEKEVRAFCFFGEALTNSLTDSTRLLDRLSMPLGLVAEVEIEKLIETIRVQPATPSWAREAIENVIRKYGWDKKVIPSDIDAPTFF